MKEYREARLRLQLPIILRDSWLGKFSLVRAYTVGDSEQPRT